MIENTQVQARFPAGAEWRVFLFKVYAITVNARVNRFCLDESNLLFYEWPKKLGVHCKCKKIYLLRYDSGRGESVKKNHNDLIIS